MARSALLTVIVACLLDGVSVGAWNTLSLVSAESFPTSLRASSGGVLTAAGRVGSIVGQVSGGACLIV